MLKRVDKPQQGTQRKDATAGIASEYRLTRQECKKSGDTGSDVRRVGLGADREGDIPYI